jgi:hypothetical protein
MGAVEKRLREESAKLRVEINEEKSRKVDLSKGGSFGFLGFEYRRIRSRKGKWRAHYVPKLKKRTALLRKLKDVFRRYVSQPVERVIELINPILRGGRGVNRVMPWRSKHKWKREDEWQVFLVRIPIRNSSVQDLRTRGADEEEILLTGSPLR